MNKTFAENIRELRTSSKLTQTEFAEKINVTQAALSAYEKGTRQPTYETLISISKMFYVSIDWLCGLSDRKHIQHQEYQDVFKELVKISTIKYPPKSETEYPNVFRVEYDRENMFTISFKTNDTNFFSFFNAWLKMYQNYSEGLIDEDIYNIWLERELAKYNFPINGLPAFMA